MVEIDVVAGKGESVIGGSIAVIINAVTDFSSSGIDGDVSIIAIGMIGDEAGTGIITNGIARIGKFTVAIVILVRVVGGEDQPVIGCSVTIIICAITGFGGSRMDGRVCIVTVEVVDGKASSRIGA